MGEGNIGEGVGEPHGGEIRLSAQGPLEVTAAFYLFLGNHRFGWSICRYLLNN